MKRKSYLVEEGCRWQSDQMNIKITVVKNSRVFDQVSFAASGMVTIRCFGVKSVLGAGIDLVRVGLIVVLHRFFGRRNVLIDIQIFFTVMSEHRRLYSFDAF